ncbi:MAG TPA: hypothetical protein VMC08_07560 [Bacteroidales bacterium]|nr:hypothetical protein [Bacteroidales bacterium]
MYVKSAKILILLLLLMLAFPPGARSQESDKSKKDKFWHRVSVGGNLGFQFGSVAGIVITPEVKVRIVDQLYGGLGFTYEYNHFKNYYYDTKSQQYLDFNLNIFGGRIFFRYYLASIFNNFLGNIFAHVEYEYLTYTWPYVVDNNGNIVDYTNTVKYSKGRQVIEVNSLFVGAGYKQPLSNKVYLDLLILFNLNETYYSPYSNPLFRLGFGYQF